MGLCFIGREGSRPCEPQALIAISQGDEVGARGWWNRVRLQPATPPQAVNSIRQAFQQQFGRPLP